MRSSLFTFALVVLLSIGCSTISVKSDGSVRATAIGQATAQHCPEATPEKSEPDCTIVAGGSFSDGFVGLLKDFVKLPFALIVGAATAAAAP